MIFSFVEKLFHEAHSANRTLISFSPGDLVRGKILKLFPNQTALVQFNNSKLVARLNTPLTARTSYWFEVQQGGDGETKLKVLAHMLPSSGNETIEDAAGALLKEFQLPQLKVNQKMISFFMEKGVPLPKGKIKVMSEWIAASDNIDIDLQTIEKMMKLRLPVTKEVFSSIRSLYDGTSFARQLQTLGLMLKEDQESLRGTINRVLSPLQYEKGKEIVAFLLHSWLQGREEPLSTASFSLLQKLSIIPETMSQENAIRMMMLELCGELAKNVYNPSETTDKHGFHLNEGQNVENDSLQSVNVLTQGKLTGINLKEAFYHLIVSREAGGMRNEGIGILQDGQIQLEVMFTPFHEKSAIRNIIFEAAQRLPQLQLEDWNEKEVAEKLLAKESGDFSSSMVTGKQVAWALKYLLSSLGLEHEAEVASLFKGQSTQLSVSDLDSLKSLLLHAQKQATNGLEKEAINRIVYKITGLQLLWHTDGPVTNFLMHFPMMIGSELFDTSIHWSGRKQSTGQIDPNFCRILFYLELQALKETVVDVTVQNRIVTINLINGHSGLSDLVTTMLPILKSNLERLNYYLSAVKVTLPQGENSGQEHASLHKSAYEPKTYTGVDIKI